MNRPKQKLEGRALPIVLSTIFLDAIGIGILFPILSQLVYKIFIPAGYSPHTAFIILGWLAGIYPAMQFFATPILGQLSDRFGRRKVLGLSIFTTALGYALFALGIVMKSIPVLFIARAIAGIAGGNISVARAVVADVSTAERRTRNFGLIGAAMGMGFVLGPFLGARLSAPNANLLGLHTPSWFDATTPFWFAAILSAINVILLIMRLPETNKYLTNGRVIWTKALTNIRIAATSRELRTILLTEFAFWGGFAFFTTFLPLQLMQRLHYGPDSIGNFFAFIGICIALAQGILIPLLAKRFENYQVVRGATLAMAAALFLQLAVHSTITLVLVGALIAFCYSVFMTNASALVSSSASGDIQGEVLGIEASVQALGESIPAIVAGYIATIGINTPTLVGASVVLAGGILFNLFYRVQKGGLHVTNGIVEQ